MLLVAGVVVVVVGAIMSMLDITVVGVALPPFQRVFTATPAQTAWTMTGYTLALASVIWLTGWAADRFGTQRLYMLAVGLFTAGSVLCAAANSVEVLTIFRVLQGLGGGMMMPLGMTIMTRAARSGADRPGDGRARCADAPGPDRSPTPPGCSPPTARLFRRASTSSACCCSCPAWHCAGLLLVLGFVVRTLFRAPEHPLMDLQLFRNRALSVAVVAMAFSGASLLFPSSFLQVRGEDTLTAGLLPAPQGVGAMLTIPAAGILTDRIGPGKVVLAGISVIVVVVGMAMLTTVGADTSSTFLLAALFMMGLGMGATMMHTTQQITASMGTALFSVLLTDGFESS